MFSMHTAHLANVSKSVTKNATFSRTGGLPCLITHSCMSAASPTVVGHKSASAECGASAQNQATTHRQNCHNIAMFIFDKWKSEIKQNGYYSSFHFFY